MFLDTNAYGALAIGKTSVIEAIRSVSELSLPLPVIAELRYGFAKGSQPEKNERTLQRFIAQPHVSVAIPTVLTTEYYAELQVLCQRRGKALSQNDIWIAALVREADGILVTFDKDFEVFANVFRNKLRILS